MFQTLIQLQVDALYKFTLKSNLKDLDIRKNIYIYIYREIVRYFYFHSVAQKHKTCHLYNIALTGHHLVWNW